MNKDDLLREVQSLSPRQMVIICGLAMHKIRDDIAYMKDRVEMNDNMSGGVNLTANQIMDAGILVGLEQAESAFHDVFTSGIWKNDGGAENV